MTVYSNFITSSNMFINANNFGANYYPMPTLMPMPYLFSFGQSSFLPNFNFGFLGSSFPSFMGNMNFNFGTTSNSKSAKGSVLKMLEIARGEYRKGVHETSKNDSTEIQKYKLGAKNNQPWCAAFATWCAKQAGLCRNGLNWTMSSQQVKNAAQDKFAKKTNYTPIPGDFAIWTNVNDNTHGHIGIVDEVSNGYVYIIEGNSDNAIKRKKYAINDLKNSARFNGYVKTSEWVA